MVLRKFFIQSAFLALTLVSSHSHAAASGTYPNKTVKLSVGFPAGQMTDLLTRVLAERLSKSLGQSVIVENKPGQGGSVALSQLARAKPDGYELMLSPTAALVINPSLYESVSYNTLKDLAPIAKVAEVPFILVANSSMPFDDVQGFVEYARKNPGKLSYTSPGNGTLPHLGMMLFQSKTGISMEHIPYKGSPRAMTDLAAGRVDVGFDTEVVTKPFVEEKKMKILAVTSQERVPSLPDVPTIRESGINDFELLAWFGIVAPQGTPKSVISLINGKVQEATHDEEFISLLGTTGATPSPSSTEEFQQLLKTDLAKWKKVVSELSATAD